MEQDYSYLKETNWIKSILFVDVLPFFSILSFSFRLVLELEIRGILFTENIIKNKSIEL